MDTKIKIKLSALDTNPLPLSSVTICRYDILVGSGLLVGMLLLASKTF